MAKRSVENRTIEIIMLESDRYLWEKYEVVRVKPIYAKNILLPQKKAVLATPGNLNNFKQKMEAAEAQRAKKAAGYEDMVAKIVAEGGLTFEKKSNEKGVLYSKLDALEIAQMISDTYSIKVDSHLLKMKKKIGTSGEFKILFSYKNIEKEIPITVKAIVEKKAKESMNKVAPVEAETTEKTDEIATAE